MTANFEDNVLALVPGSKVCASLSEQTPKYPKCGRRTNMKLSLILAPLAVVPLQQHVQTRECTRSVHVCLSHLLPRVFGAPRPPGLHRRCRFLPTVVVLLQILSHVFDRGPDYAHAATKVTQVSVRPFNSTALFSRQYSQRTSFGTTA